MDDNIKILIEKNKLLENQVKKLQKHLKLIINHSSNINFRYKKGKLIETIIES